VEELQQSPGWMVPLRDARSRYAGRKEPDRGAASEDTEMPNRLHLGVLAAELAVYAMLAAHIVPTSVGYNVMVLCRAVEIGVLFLDKSQKTGAGRGRSNP
jgi:hypothetical protein